MNPKLKIGLIIAGAITFLFLYTIAIVVFTIKLSPKNNSELELREEQFNKQMNDLREEVKILNKEQKLKAERDSILMNNLSILIQEKGKIKTKYDKKRISLVSASFSKTARGIARRYNP